jgi:hypothetical protein
LTIETICKLEEALGIKLGSVLDGGEPTLVKTSRTKK